MARFTRHTNVTMFSFTSYALVCSKLLSVMVKTRIPWPRTFSFTFQYALETQLLFFVARLLSIHGFLDRFSLVAWRDCDVIVYSLFLFFFSFLLFPFFEGETIIIRENVNERSTSLLTRLYRHKHCHESGQSVVALFLPPLDAAPPWAPYHLRLPLVQLLFSRFISAQRNDSQPTDTHVILTFLIWIVR